MIRLVLLFVLFASPVFAQEPQSATPSQTAIQINTVVGQWAQTLEAQHRQITEMQSENAKLKAEIERLKKDMPKPN